MISEWTQGTIPNFRWPCTSYLRLSGYGKQIHYAGLLPGHHPVCLSQDLFLDSGDASFVGGNDAYDMGVSENSGTPKSSIFIGFSIINYPFWGTTIFGNAHIDTVDGIILPCCLPTVEEFFLGVDVPRFVGEEVQFGRRQSVQWVFPTLPWFQKGVLFCRM